MNYKYRISQLFKKRLNVPKNVPKDVRKKIYRSNLSLKDYINYDLIDKVPFSCLSWSVSLLAEFLKEDGLKKLKTMDLDLNLVERYAEDIRKSLSSYDIIPDNIIEIINRIIFSRISKDEKKDYLQTLLKNQFQMSNEEIESFNNKYENILNILLNNYNFLNDFDVINFIKNIIKMHDDKDKIRDYLSKYTDEILANTHRKINDFRTTIKLSNDEYKEIFKYSSMEEYLKVFNEREATTIIEELKSLPQDYVFNMSIPFSELLNYDVLSFIGTYGLKNIVDFDNECDHFFSNNNCEMLKLMYDMYIRYAANEHDPNKTIYTKKKIDENDNYIDRPYTKDEFYEAMKRMIIYGPSNWSYADKAPDYRNMTGEFRTRNKELFIAEDAPEELQKLFYTKSITPQLLLEHPEYIQYLKEKDLSSCFKNRTIRVDGSDSLGGYENFYKFLSSKTDFDSVMNFITEYSDVLDIVLDYGIVNDYQYEIKFSNNDDINQVQNRIHETLRKLIIEKGLTYPTHIPKKLTESYPSMFLDKNAPKELQEAFYNRAISTAFILSNPTYREYLKDIDLEFIFRYMPVNVINENNEYEQINIVNGIKQILGSDDAFDVMILYGKYIKKIFDDNRLQRFKFNPNFSKNDLIDELDKTILQNIVDGNMKYDESIPSHFKNNNPTLFLGTNVPPEIRKKFYNREFTLKDFDDNPELFDIFENTNIACAFSENMSWIIPLFNETDNFKIANYKRMKVITAYSKIQDVELQKAFKEYVMEFETNIDVEKIEYASEVISRLSLSNSSEIFTFRKELATQMLKSNNPLEVLNKIEDIFIKNNIPTVGKIYSCFEILHPNFQGFNFESSMISPILKKASTKGKKAIVFLDLIKSSFGSNNRSVNAYLKNIEIGSNLYESIKSGQIQYDSIRETEIRELTAFCNHLATLYNNTIKGKKESEIFIPTGNIIEDISTLKYKLSPDGTIDYNISDRIIRMFCGLAGINTLEEAKGYINNKIKTADSRNRNAGNTDLVLEQGDFIKGIGNIRYLRNILQNGSNSREFLGADAGSDSTPLDTDVSMIMNSDGTIAEKMDATAASVYGPIWIVLKNDDRFITTRTSSETLEAKRDMSKMEVFYTGALGEGHYGIRTGFASSEINYIVMDNYDPRVGLEIAMNGFYIPVANKEGKIVFTPKDYDELRTKMSGLSYFGEQNYSFSENLVTEETEHIAQQVEQSNHEVKVKREKINSIIKKSLEELGLHLKTNIDGDLTEGFVELIDTGSTGRGTNKPGDGDFDFMMRLDKNILSNPTKLNKIKQTILRNLGKENSSELTGTGDFRLKSVQIDNDISVDIDITFTEKTDKVSYSTDMALQDRLATIQRNDPEKYKYVVANILLAKQVLKKAEAYKPNRGEIPQGGLGGVGIENWILQNGGSFIDAARSFVEAADGKSFSEFQSTYQIWDFGDNHLAERRGQYAHDNFVANNMSEEGYIKMDKALREYLNSIELNHSQTTGIKR